MGRRESNFFLILFKICDNVLLMENAGVRTVDPREQAPTVKNILEGRAKITHLGEEITRSRNIDGREWLGSQHNYELTTPSPSKPGETWTTTLSVWAPAPLEPPRFTKRPDTQVFILTGHGEMPFSDPETNSKVVDEINRQMEEQRKMAEQNQRTSPDKKVT